MKKYMYLAALASMFVVGCSQKENAAPEAIGGGNKINLTISVDYPQMTPDSKVAFEGTQLKWTGDETLSVLIGRAGTTINKAGGLQVTLNSVPGFPGTFSGEVQLDTFTVNDIKGIVVPAENGAYFAYDNEIDRICMPVASKQTQSVSGVFNTAYCPFFAEVNTLGSADADGKYVISNHQLYSGSDLIGLNVYGKHPAMSEGEVLKSVKLTANDKIVGGSKYNMGAVANEKWTIGVSTSTSSNVTVNFEGNETIADKTKDNGIKLFASVAMNGKRNFSEVEVVTDKAVYTKTIDFSNVDGETTLQKDIRTLRVFNAGLNLAKFERIGNDLSYSTDGGNTWVDELPAQLNGTLIVNGASLTSDALAAIKTVLAAQSVPTALDLSQTVYEEATFPATFAGTETAPNTYLKGMKFPSNVTTIAESAFLYCSAMTSVDLTGITTINNSAFRYCGLQTLNVPNTVKSYGTYIFADNYDLTSVYYNSPYDPGTASSANRFTFHLSNKNLADPCLVVTIGPDAKDVPRCCFRNNNSLIKIIIEGASYFRQYAICYCENLAVLEYRCTDAELLTTSSIGFGSIHANKNVEEYPGNNLPASERKVIVPAGMTSVYTPLLARLLNDFTVNSESHNYGFTVVEAN